MTKLIEISKNLLLNSLGLKKNENLLIVTDEVKEELASFLYEAGKTITKESSLIKFSGLEKSGAEPPTVVAQAMLGADIVVCITEHSMTHTSAKKKAVQSGARVATMPGITKEMFLEGAITADYVEVEKRTKALAEVLSSAKNILIVKDGCRLEFSVEGRNAFLSTGRYLEKGQSGNLPSGEAFIAPLEGSANGKIVIDGSISGVGKLKGAITVEIKEGRLVSAEGPQAQEWLKILGDSKEARNLAEFAFGTNPCANLTGNILEDEKMLGSIHVAFGSNNTFGGKVSAGIHLDAVTLKPTVYLDGNLIMEKGIFKTVI